MNFIIKLPANNVAAEIPNNIPNSVAPVIAGCKIVMKNKSGTVTNPINNAKTNGNNNKSTKLMYFIKNALIANVNEIIATTAANFNAESLTNVDIAKNGKNIKDTPNTNNANIPI